MLQERSRKSFIAAGRSAVTWAVRRSKTLGSMPWGLSWVLSGNGGRGATSTAALTRAGPWTAR
jgi:hypothetical protein